MNQSDQLCNLCGHSCYFHCNSIGVNVSVSGAYYSTPGNGFGALDDMVGYQFSLCEFCLDWMFAQFKIPVKVDYQQIAYSPKEEDFKPAPQRVIEDDWRVNKEIFFKEATLRAESRGKEYKDLERYKKLLPFK